MNYTEGDHWYFAHRLSKIGGGEAANREGRLRGTGSSPNAAALTSLPPNTPYPLRAYATANLGGPLDEWARLTLAHLAWAGGLETVLDAVIDGDLAAAEVAQALRAHRERRPLGERADREWCDCGDLPDGAECVHDWPCRVGTPNRSCPCGGTFFNGSCPDCGRPAGCTFSDCSCDPEVGCRVDPAERPQFSPEGER